MPFHRRTKNFIFTQNRSPFSLVKLSNLKFTYHYFIINSEFHLSLSYWISRLYGRLLQSSASDMLVIWTEQKFMLWLVTRPLGTLLDSMIWECQKHLTYWISIRIIATVSSVDNMIFLMCRPGNSVPCSSDPEFAFFKCSSNNDCMLCNTLSHW